MSGDWICWDLITAIDDADINSCQAMQHIYNETRTRSWLSQRQKAELRGVASHNKLRGLNRLKLLKVASKSLNFPISPRT